ncbi:hypothetical protein HK103_005870 [Boothiomyces macroporosus]|uniref:MFS transporter n=1 Tax=Boothiomyces macroporosus TaxID=261099 RepID=A0AAD5UHH3_9FUNG|nr:hypothetical protein HK103_005870 [Boothiomyces macroporosus]
MVEYDPQEQELVKRIDSKVIPSLVLVVSQVSLYRLINLHTISPLYEYAGVDAFFSDSSSLMNIFLNITLLLIHSIISALIAIAVFVNLPPYPENCTFLNTADRILANARGRDGFGNEDESISRSSRGNSPSNLKFVTIQLKDILFESKNYIVGLLFLLFYCNLDNLSVITPAISEQAYNISCIVNCDYLELEHDKGEQLVVLLLTLAPMAVGCILSYIFSVKTDKTGNRTFQVAIGLSLTTFGYLVLSISELLLSNLGKYLFGLFPIVIGMMIALPALLAHAMDNTQSDTYRISVSTPMIVSLFGIHGISERNVVSFFLSVISLGLLYFIHRQTQQLEVARGPGLRRLLNDADEAKAWEDGFEMELTDMDFKKTANVEGWSSNDDLGSI